MTLNEQIATGFGIGRVPYTPGTAASFVAVIIAIPVMYLLGWFGLFVLATITTVGGVWVSEAYAVEVGRNDPSECVIDEFAGQWLACALAGLGAYTAGEPLGAAGYIIAFVVFRLFDVAKPWPVSKAEELKGGFGIVADDVVAGLIAGLFAFLVEQSGLI